MHHRADETHTDLLGGTGAEDVSPELLSSMMWRGWLRSSLVSTEAAVVPGAMANASAA